MAKAFCTIRAANTNEAHALSALALRSKAHWGYPNEFIAACREVLCSGQVLEQLLKLFRLTTLIEHISSAHVLLTLQSSFLQSD